MWGGERASTPIVGLTLSTCRPAAALVPHHQHGRGGGGGNGDHCGGAHANEAAHRKTAADIASARLPGAPARAGLPSASAPACVVAAALLNWRCAINAPNAHVRGHKHVPVPHGEGYRRPPESIP